MKKTIISLVTLIFGLFLATSQSGSANSATYQYLTGYPDNAWAVMALRAAGQPVNANGLSVENLATATDLERVILGAVAGAADPYNFKSRNLVQELDGKRNNKQLGDVKLVNDDIFGILAYVSAGIPTSDSRIQDSKAFVLANQNSDGGFAYATKFPSDTNITAMAITSLLRSGVNAQNESIQNALAYLKLQQNNDGGFGIQAGEPSDAASTAWVISALQTAGIDANEWRKQQDPYEFLESLLTADGSYKWRASDSMGQSTMTAYAVIAQSNASYPVAALPERQPAPTPAAPAPTQPAPTPTTPAPTTPVSTPKPNGTLTSAIKPQVRYRIEGNDKQLCQGEAPARDALEVLQQAAAKCKFTYDLGGSGLYPIRIGSEQSQGNQGWYYLVNWQHTQQMPGNYALNANDYVTWYYGGLDLQSVKLMLEDVKPIDNGAQITLNLEVSQQNQWNPTASTIYVNDQAYDGLPTTRINLAPGTYTVYAHRPGFVRGHVSMISVR